MSRRMPLIVIAALLLAACGDGGGRDAGGDAGEDLPRQAVATSDDPEGTIYPLAPGRYRLSWRAEGCRSPEIRIVDAGGEAAYDQSPRIGVVFVQDLPGGEMTIEQNNAECTEWRITLDRF